MKTLLAGMFVFASMLTGLVLVFFPMPARAQAGEAVQLYPPDTSQFPIIHLNVDVRDPSGGFVSGLNAGDITLVENGAFVPVDELQEIDEGLEISIAINASPSMAVRNAEGVARYDRIAQTLSDWAAQASSNTVDTYSLYTNGGKSLVRSGDPMAWLQAFKAYQADFRNSQPALESLSAAITAAGGGTDQPGVRRAILWITSPPEGALLASLADLQEPLQKSGARLMVWSVSTPAAFQSAGAQALQQLAEGSGGQFFAFSGVEDFPDLQAFLQPLRGIYQLAYRSTARKGGEQSLSAQVQVPEGVSTSQALSFSIDLQPPNPMLLSAPPVIQRTSPAESLEPLAALTPLTQEIRMLVEFPDGYTRELQATRLYVDGAMVAENTAAPFDRFLWDLSSYTQTDQHMLKVEVEDSLGLTSQSLEIPVDIQVIIPPADLKTQINRHRNLVTWAAILVAGLVLGSVVLVGARKGYLHRKPAPTVFLSDPLSEPSSSRGANQSHGHLAWLDLASGKHGWKRGEAAALAWLGVDGEVLPKAPIKITSHQTLFGRDPTLVNCVLADASVEAQHARLECDEQGACYLYDMGSVAGTWVNYAPVSPGGTHLEHSDIIHIGRAAFRFLQIHPETSHTGQVETFSET